MQVNEEYKKTLDDSNKKIYESPDGGKTVYERDFGADPSTRTLIKSSVQQQWKISFRGEEIQIPQNLAGLL